MATCLASHPEPSPITITCNSTDTVIITIVASTYKTWSAWAASDTPQCTDPDGCYYTESVPLTPKGWWNLFDVSVDGGTTWTKYADGAAISGPGFLGAKVYPSDDIAFSKFVPITLSGYTEYLIGIRDPYTTDNRGGLCFEYTVHPKINNVLMFSCNT